jgi:hypothetical protein
MSFDQTETEMMIMKRTSFLGMGLVVGLAALVGCPSQPSGTEESFVEEPVGNSDTSSVQDNSTGSSDDSAADTPDDNSDSSGDGNTGDSGGGSNDSGDGSGGDSGDNSGDDNNNNNNGGGDPPPGDLDGNGTTDVGDVLILVGNWGATTNIAGDLDGDGDVDFHDLTAMLSLVIN